MGRPKKEKPEVKELDKETLADLLKKYVDKVERVNEELDSLRDVRKSLYSESEEEGLDKKALKELIKLRKKDRNEVEEQKCLLYTYEEALKN